MISKLSTSFFVAGLLLVGAASSASVCPKAEECSPATRRAGRGQRGEAAGTLPWASMSALCRHTRGLVGSPT
jgi:hypothetical protein